MSGFTQLPNQIVDLYMAKLSDKALRLILAITRKTLGWNKEADYISHSQLKALTGMVDDRTIKSGVEELAALGLITVQQRTGKAAIYMVNFGGDPLHDAQEKQHDVQADPLHDVQPYKIKITKQNLPKRGESPSPTDQPREVIPDTVDQSVLDDFAEHRRQIGKPLTDLSRTKLIETLAALTRAQQRQAADYSIQGGYAGIFADRFGNKSGGQRGNQSGSISRREHSRRMREHLDSLIEAEFGPGAVISPF